jgi:hypothetical protein
MKGDKICTDTNRDIQNAQGAKTFCALLPLIGSRRKRCSVHHTSARLASVVSSPLFLATIVACIASKRMCPLHPIAYGSFPLRNLR